MIDASPARRHVFGFVIALVLPTLLTVCLAPFTNHVNLVSDMLLFLLVTVACSMMGGFSGAVVAAVTSSALLNYYFTPPLHTFDIEDANNAFALVVFITVGLLVSWAMTVVARRTREAALAAPLAEANKIRTALLAAVGHDLRTPLAAAKASVSGLRSRDIRLDRSDRDELLKAADESLDKLTALVENLLDMSRLQAGAMPIVLASTSIDEVAAHALDAFGPQASRVLIDIPDDLPVAVADAGLLERVLANLTANALRHSPPDRPPTLVACKAPEAIQIRVIDRGPGIPSVDLDRVFLPFQRLGDTDNSTGVGLGLALSRGLTEAMGGTLELEETPGGGLTMVVSLRVSDEKTVLEQGDVR